MAGNLTAKNTGSLMARPQTIIAPMFGLPPDGWTVGSTYTTRKGKEMKMEVRHYKDSTTAEKFDEKKEHQTFLGHSIEGIDVP